METVTTKQQNTEVLASDILLAILVNLKRFSGNPQLFMKAKYHTFQDIFMRLCIFSDKKFIQKYFISSDSGPVPFSPSLQQAIEELQLAGMICWPDTQEPNLMRLNLSAEDWYEKVIEKVLANDGKEGSPLRDIVTAQQIAEIMATMWPELIVDRPHLMNC